MQRRDNQALAVRKCLIDQFAPMALDTERLHALLVARPDQRILDQ